MRLLRKPGDTPKRSLWQKLKDVALADVGVLVRGGVKAGSLEQLERLLLRAKRKIIVRRCPHEFVRSDQKATGAGRRVLDHLAGLQAMQGGFAAARRLIADRGYEATTLRDIAKEADVSVGLLYRYFPGKQAIVIALYDQLSAEYARQAADMPSGKWREVPA